LSICAIGKNRLPHGIGGDISRSSSRIGACARKRKRPAAEPERRNAMSDRIFDKPDGRTDVEGKDMSRRRMLALLGITGAATYVAPTLLSLDQARASGGSSGGSGGGGGGDGRGGRGSGGSGGRGSRGSGGSRGSRGSGGHGRRRSVDTGNMLRPIRRIFS